MHRLRNLKRRGLAIGSRLPDCREDFFENPVLELNRVRHFGARDEAVKIRLIYVRHGLNTTRCRGVTFRDTPFNAVFTEGFARVSITESLANIGGAEKRFAVFNDDADVVGFESEGLGEFVCHFHFSVSFTRSSAHSRIEAADLMTLRSPAVESIWLSLSAESAAAIRMFFASEHDIIA